MLSDDEYWTWERVESAREVDIDTVHLSTSPPLNGFTGWKPDKKLCYHTTFGHVSYTIISWS